MKLGKRPRGIRCSSNTVSPQRSHTPVGLLMSGGVSMTASTRTPRGASSYPILAAAYEHGEWKLLLADTVTSRRTGDTIAVA